LNTHQQLNTTCRRTRTQKWPRPFETHGISMSRVHMRDVATQSRVLQRLASNSLRMQLPDLTVDVILARTSSLAPQRLHHTCTANSAHTYGTASLQQHHQGASTQLKKLDVATENLAKAHVGFSLCFKSPMALVILKASCSPLGPRGPPGDPRGLQ
jgi:hypothetical protein